MKLNQSFIVMFFVLLSLSACRDDEYKMEEGAEIPIGTGIIVEGNLNGLIVNGLNQPLPGVLIEAMGESTYTDDNGFFRFMDIALKDSGSLVKISKEGYLNSYKFSYAEPGEDSYIRHVLPPIGGASYPNMASGPFIIPLNGGAEISIPPGSATYLDGSIYDGRVNVRNRFYDPSDINLAASMPDDLRGINNEGELVQLVTYGMIGVEIESESGEPLQLTETLPATLKFPIPENYPTKDTIPMWYLNEDTGYWIEEGFAIKQDNFMVTEVTHFSFWNCDDPFPLIELKGTMIDQNGAPLANQLVIITTDNMLTGTGHTNQNGHFRGKVPQGLDLNLSINVCDEEVDVINLGAFDVDTDLEEITINVIDHITINTRLVNCMGQAISGYAIIKTDVSTEIVLSDDDGIINFKMLTCNDGDGTIQGVDTENGIFSEKIPFSLANSLANIPDVEVCGDAIELGTVNYTLYGFEKTMTGVEATIVDETYLYVYGEMEGIGLYPEIVQLMFLIEGESHTSLGREFLLDSYVAGYDENGEYKGENLIPSNLEDLESTAVQNIGDPLVGTLSTSFKELSMNLVINQKVATGAINGKRWLDNNMDGIKDESEPWSPDLSDFKAESKDTTQRLIRYYQGMPFSTLGDYWIHGLAPNQEFKLTWGTGGTGNIKVSPAHQGTDESKDCDFEINSMNVYETEYFFVGEGETIEDVGFGYTTDFSCEILPICCPITGMSFRITNGFPPFTVEMISPTFVYAPLTFDQEEFDVKPIEGDYGTYEIEVKDSQGNNCTRTYEHKQYLNAISGIGWIDVGDTPDIYDQNDAYVINLEVNLYNDDGVLVESTNLNAFGQYSFQGVKGDRYRIEVMLPTTDHEFVALGSIGEENDNHIDPATGFSEFIDIADYDVGYTINAGIKLK